MAQVLVRDLDPAIVEKLKARAADHGRSLQAELKAILEAQASQATKAEARALATCIRQRITIFPSSLVIEPALEVAFDTDCTVYDSCYLALAMLVDCQLVTADQRL